MPQGWIDRSDTLRTIERRIRSGVTKIQAVLDRRRFPRLLDDTVICSLGPVIDLSAGGMRLLCNRRLKGPQDVKLRNIDDQITLRAKVAWCKRVGFRRHEVGLEFLNVTPDAARSLAALATANPKQVHWPLDAA